MGNEWKYVKDCQILDDFLLVYVNMFENLIADYTGSKYAIACMNGTRTSNIFNVGWRY